MWRERLSELRPFLIGSYAIAFAQWALSPKIASQWWLTGINFHFELIILSTFVLAFIWTGLVAAGFKKCGWPGILMLGSLYGLYPFWFWGAMTWVCARHGDCL